MAPSSSRRRTTSAAREHATPRSPCVRPPTTRTNRAASATRSSPPALPARRRRTWPSYDNVKTGDNGPAPLSVTFPATSTNGGTIVEGATDGTFIYTPALDFGGPSDTFTYTLTDANSVTNTGTVTINLSNIVWYVNSSGGEGDGRSHNPFNTLERRGHTVRLDAHHLRALGRRHDDGEPGDRRQPDAARAGRDLHPERPDHPCGHASHADRHGDARRTTRAVRAVNFTPSAIPAMAASAVSFAQPVTIDQVNVTGGTSALSLTNVTATATGAINVSNAAFTNTSAAEVLICQGTDPGDARRHGDHQQQRRPVDRHPEPHRRHGHLQRARSPTPGRASS